MPIPALQMSHDAASQLFLRRSGQPKGCILAGSLCHGQGKETTLKTENTHTHIYIYIYTYLFMYLFIYVCIYSSIYLFICLLYIYIYIYENCALRDLESLSISLGWPKGGLVCCMPPSWGTVGFINCIKIPMAVKLHKLGYFTPLTAFLEPLLILF